MGDRGIDRMADDRWLVGKHTGARKPDGGEGAMMSTQLHRSSQDRVLCGVAGGLAESFKVDPTLVRVAFVATCFLSGGTAVLLYIVLAILMPREGASATAPTEVMRGNVRSILSEVMAAVREAADAVRRPPSGGNSGGPAQGGAAPEGGQPAPGASTSEHEKRFEMTQSSAGPESEVLSKEIREEVQAHLAARRDLGPEFEDVVVDSLVEKVEKSLGDRIDAKIAQARLSGGRSPAQRVNPMGLMAIVPCLGIPLTAVVGGVGGLAGIITVWGAVGLLVVYFDRRR
jgi:phage shock protein PspC (stress-responsive transcriptional regulator)